MTISPEPLIYLAILASVYMLIGGIYLLVFGPSIRLNRRVNRRIALMDKGQSRSEVLATLRREMDQHGRARSLPFYALLAERAQKANIAFTPGMLMGLMGLLCVVSFGLLTVLTDAAPVMVGVLSVVFGIGSVWAWVGRAAKKRLSMLEEQLPEAVELMVRSLRVGHPLAAAIGIVAKELSDPLGSEMGFIADEAAYGRDVADALRALAERTGLQDLRFLSVAVGIQKTSGGNLAEILDGLAKVIRARFKLFRKVKAITAEARWSGVFLSAFPILAAVGINVMEPNYYADVKDTPYFLPAVGVVVVMLIVNIMYMRMMVNIKV